MRQVLWMILWVFPVFAFGQSGGTNWYFGDSVGIAFDSTAKVTTLQNSNMLAYEGCATLSDSQGNLLFYTNGLKVWDASHSQMPNGLGLTGNESTCQSLIVPHPGADSLFYIFTSHHLAGYFSPQQSGGFSYSVVDMSLNGGKGDVLVKNQQLFGPATEKMGYLRHANGRDIWVLCHEWNNNRFRAYLIDCHGLDTNYVSTAIGNSHDAASGSYNGNASGALKFSPDGSQVAIALYSSHLVEVFDFDRATGKLKDGVTLTGLTFPYGLEFSPNSKRLYVTCGGSNDKIHQFDLSAGSAGAINASKTVLVVYSHNNGYPTWGDLALGPDGRIYVARVNEAFLSVINTPDLVGMSCAFADTGLMLPRNSYMGLPHRASRAEPGLSGQDFTWVPACADSLVQFSDSSTLFPDAVTWYFGGIGSTDSSQLSAPDFSFAQAGNYWVTRISEFSCYSDTVSHQVTVYAPPSPYLGADTGLCPGMSISLSAPGPNISWWDGSQVSEMEVTQPGQYWCEQSNAWCSSRDTLKVVSLSPPAVAFPADTLICPGTGAILEAIPLKNDSAYSYLWSEGSQGNSLFISSPGLYELVVSNGACELTGQVEVAHIPSLQSNLLPRYELCKGSFLSLDGGSNAQGWLWSDGSTSSSLTLSTPGHYFLEKSNSCESRTDSFQVVLKFAPEVDLGADVTICGNAGPQIRPNLSNAVSLNWQDGSAAPVYQVSEAGWLWLEATNACGKSRDSLWVEALEGTETFLPNIFSPNGDGANDEFRFTPSSPDGFALQITDRWGKAIFQSQSPNHSWKGQLPRGGAAPEGVYFYTVRMADCEGKLQEFAGSVTLVR